MPHSSLEHKLAKTLIQTLLSQPADDIVPAGQMAILWERYYNWLKLSPAFAVTCFGGTWAAFFGALKFSILSAASAEPAGAAVFIPSVGMLGVGSALLASPIAYRIWRRGMRLVLRERLEEFLRFRRNVNRVDDRGILRFALIAAGLTGLVLCAALSRQRAVFAADTISIHDLLDVQTRSYAYASIKRATRFSSIQRDLAGNSVRVIDFDLLFDDGLHWDSREFGHGFRPAVEARLVRRLDAAATESPHAP